MIVRIVDAILCDFVYWCEISNPFDREAPSHIDPQSWRNPFSQSTSVQYIPQTTDF